ncbi:putative sigma-54 modulation protein [Nonlabens dokdonensis]|jgi:putative sigma-54 modulation protein|uniref:Site-specific recombinase, phage integrase family/ribosomal subunit interface protein n=2 Tax=Nonlabens dokdonensis TaxID=328515 RepID=L7WAH2_NONDD|nr:HPF/RaiA family ribosome-associated protein [Nonlabens dokdonensis]AGC75873.1 site-specific recombinase, phage integrase family/ribosomal subunit interface protein [Nonlabens dokdonensis DSW-6]PZX43556.1 putative sigma-54 modulation protein [Nonlabens dokdonensis]
MKTNTQFVQMAHSPSMQAFVEKKLSKLYNKYSWIIKTDVAFKQENNDSKKGKICTMEVSVPGPKIFASANEHNYELAVSTAIDSLNIQLEKRKSVMVEY